MSRRQYEIPSNSAADLPLRVFYCATSADLPGAQSVRLGDIFFVADEGAIYLGTAAGSAPVSLLADHETRITALETP